MIRKKTPMNHVCTWGIDNLNQFKLLIIKTKSIYRKTSVEDEFSSILIDLVN
jgi:hypothetical protein